MNPTTNRLAVRKTYKLFVGGAFPRSESGRSYVVSDHHGDFLANAALGSRKDVRDAVTAARNAFPGWSARTGYNRGQVLYRIAEMLEGRRAQFVDAVGAGEGLTGAQAGEVIDATIDRWVWYAGWADKVASVLGSSNQVAGPYFDFSVPEPTGVVAILCPQDSSLLGLVSTIAPAIVTGNTVVAIPSEHRPLPAMTLAEVLATSDLPAGVLNLVTGRVPELAPWLAAHMDVDALDLAGLSGPPGQAAEQTPAQAAERARDLEIAAADNLKRVVRPAAADPDWHADPGLDRLASFLEIKTVWHPVGS